MLSLPPATRFIILANVVVFLLQQVTPWIDALCALWPLGPYFRLWQLVTYAFLHGAWWHIFLNMFAVFMFGPQLERTWGSRRYLVYYFACIIAAAAVQLLTELHSAVPEPTVGASGGVFGLLLAFAMYYPRVRLFVIPIPIPVPAWLVVTLYGLVELYLGVSGREPNVAHFAHLGGMLGGAVVMLIWQAQARLRGQS
ncbi:MAG TPA: rhomboid family intramembrane serine protease [Steroidobacteraceae bacterium]|nr:rhomboid family intramembrane serine protease [Steroidobacteraceae bacterium]